jgi:hypothetical protein
MTPIERILTTGLPGEPMPADEAFCRAKGITFRLTAYASRNLMSQGVTSTEEICAIRAFSRRSLALPRRFLANFQHFSAPAKVQIVAKQAQCECPF